jgi:tRNA A37 threonylcarbamoyladenosine synthetase subunit TsaC/SUA5/YrdC
MDLAAGLSDEARPPVVGAGATELVEALVAGAIVAVPNVGGYSLVVRVGSLEGEARLVELAADPDGPHYAVGQIEDVRTLTSGWTDELGTLLERCWPGPVEVFLPSAASAGGPGGVGVDQAVSESGDGDGSRPSTGRHAAADADAFEDGVPDDGAPNEGTPGDAVPEYGAWAVVVGMPDGRALRRLCREQGPWLTVPLRFNEAAEVAQAFSAEDVAFVVEGGRREGATPTVVDATVTPIRVLREGALPASFIEGTMLMSTRRKLFSRTKKPAAG